MLNTPDWLAWQLQEWISYAKNMNLEEIKQLLHRYSQFGPLPGILFPFLEALLPILPLIVFVVANAAAYGMWLGFLYSWIGVTLGALLVFLLGRRFGNRYGARIRAKNPKWEKFFGYIERKGFTPIFLLSCFPFTPSVIVNIASGMSRLPFHTFLTAMALGKAVMLFILSFLGHDLQAMADQPWRIGLAIAIVILMWLGGRKLEGRYS
jgi:uncharacterized membrane protein YdjX (TVP38/TMEM64 family)